MDYYLRKQKYTIYTQGVARYNLIFLDIATGYPGSLHDTRILRSSTLYPKAESGDILSRSAKLVDGSCIKSLILSDSVYPSTTWQVKPYNFNVNLTESRKLSTNNCPQLELQWKELLGFLKVVALSSKTFG